MSGEDNSDIQDTVPDTQDTDTMPSEGRSQMDSQTFKQSRGGKNLSQNTQNIPSSVQRLNKRKCTSNREASQC